MNFTITFITLDELILVGSRYKVTIDNNTRVHAMDINSHSDDDGQAEEVHVRANGSQEEQEDDFHDHSLWHRRRRLTFKSRSFNVQVELKY